MTATLCTVIIFIVSALSFSEKKKRRNQPSKADTVSSSNAIGRKSNNLIACRSYRKLTRAHIYAVSPVNIAADAPFQLRNAVEVFYRMGIFGASIHDPSAGRGNGNDGCTLRRVGRIEVCFILFLPDEKLGFFF